MEEEIGLGELPPRSGAVLEAILHPGELPRGDTAGVTGCGEVLVSATSRAPLRLAFPAALAHRWMPGLYSN